MKVLVVGDFACTTGFGTVNEALLSRVKVLTPNWDLHILGINATGDAHPLQREFKIYPADLHGSDAFGYQRIASIAQPLEPDLVVIHQDAWNVPPYVEGLKVALGKKIPPVVAWCPADSPNQYFGERLTNDVDLLLAPTQFGVNELIKGGYRGRAEVLPYGIDTTLFRPGDRREARKTLQMPEAWWDDVIFGRADRNAPRKRYDLTIRAFAQWWADHGKPQDVRMLFHCSNVDPVGWNIDQLCSYYGLDRGRVVFTEDGLHPSFLWPRERLATVYQSWDIHTSATQGEGFGLVAAESAACGVGQMLPRYSALEEIFTEGTQDRACFQRCTGTYCTPASPNTLGGVVDLGDQIWAFNHLYEDADARKNYGRLALDAVSKPDYDWDRIAERFLLLCGEVLA